jgi:tRNA (guanine26-N2/guanine27-N2)-dimethyltransferase
MSASGIRAIRMALEIPNLRIIANDLNPAAARLIRENLLLNNLKEEKGKFEISINEANRFLFEKSVERDYGTIIDIDPFGTPNVFVENAINAAHRGSLLCITATDTPVLFGVRKEACIRKYGIESFHNMFLKELGLRILITFTARLAHMHDFYITPQFSLSQEHFIRIFIRIDRGEGGIKQNLSEYGFILSCDNCFYRESFVGKNKVINSIPNICPNCNHPTQIIGPIWLGKLHDNELCKDMKSLLQTKDKIQFPLIKQINNILDLAVNEDKFPLGYYNLHQICDKHQTDVVSYKSLEETIVNAGYRFTRTYIDNKAFRTDMHINQILECIKIINDKRQLNNPFNEEEKK